MLRYLAIFLLFIFNLSCAQKIKKAVGEVKYSAYEMVGIEKRDLFKGEVEDVKEEQEETSEAFKDALTHLQEIYQVDGGKLEKQYNSLKNSFDEAAEKAKNVGQRILKLNTVAEDLFAEWQKEIQEISSPELRSKSSSKLDETRKNYHKFYDQLKTSERRMLPVLARMKDQVLFLKHNLNAQTISGLKAESVTIQNDMAKLIVEMEKSIAEADNFMKSL
jgi:hypothetical protein